MSVVFLTRSTQGHLAPFVCAGGGCCGCAAAAAAAAAAAVVAFAYLCIAAVA